MSKNNLGYEACRIMFIKMTVKSKFSPRSSENGAIVHLHDDVTRAKSSGSCSQIRAML